MSPRQLASVSTLAFHCQGMPCRRGSPPATLHQQHLQKVVKRGSLFVNCVVTSLLTPPLDRVVLIEAEAVVNPFSHRRDHSRACPISLGFALERCSPRRKRRLVFLRHSRLMLFIRRLPPPDTFVPLCPPGARAGAFTPLILVRYWRSSTRPKAIVCCQLFYRCAL